MLVIYFIVGCCFRTFDYFTLYSRQECLTLCKLLSCCYYVFAWLRLRRCCTVTVVSSVAFRGLVIMFGFIAVAVIMQSYAVVYSVYPQHTVRPQYTNIVTLTYRRYSRPGTWL